MEEKLISSKNDIKRIRTYIEGLDEQIQGGVPENSITLICGSSGSMKSSVSFNIAYHEVLKGKKALYISLEQSWYSLLNHMTNLDFNLSKINLVVISDLSEFNQKIQKVKSGKGGAFVITDIGAIRKEIKAVKISPSSDWLNVVKNVVKKMKQASGCDILIIDSLSALYVLSNFTHPRTELFYIFEFLRDLDLTCFLVSETPRDGSRYGEFGVEDFLVDGVIRLQLVERQRKVTREISVVKMRATACNVDVFSLEFENGKFKALYGGQPALI